MAALPANLRVIERGQGNAALPRPLTELVGREAESAAVAWLLRQGGARLVTLTGPGGIGKTRLSLEVATRDASDFDDGVRFADLSAFTDPTLVPVAVAKALGVPLSGRREPIDEVIEQLEPGAVLVVLVNFEQLLDAAPVLARLLSACANVALLVTSRARLNLSGEHVFAVPPLGLPPVGAEETMPARSATLPAAQGRCWSQGR